jgi:hypothetical protein
MESFDDFTKEILDWGPSSPTPPRSPTLHAPRDHDSATVSPSDSEPRPTTNDKATSFIGDHLRDFDNENSADESVILSAVGTIRQRISRKGMWEEDSRDATEHPEHTDAELLRPRRPIPSTADVPPALFTLEAEASSIPGPSNTQRLHRSARRVIVRQDPEDSTQSELVPFHGPLRPPASTPRVSGTTTGIRSIDGEYMPNTQRRESPGHGNVTMVSQVQLSWWGNVQHELSASHNTSPHLRS